MSLKKNKITFHSSDTSLDIMRPYPASRAMPDWYRKMSGVYDGVESVKKCVPFLDSLTAGYVIPLTADVAWDSANKRLISNAKFEVNSDHHSSQSQDVVIPEEFDPQPHKWINYWQIQTPKGYSTLFVHPLNRMDLPFVSFSGVVDTDKHPVVINFPFLLRKDFDGVIPAGTPLIQAIPFKRSDWESVFKDEGESYYYPKSYEVESPPFSWYKRKWWARKLYS